MPTTKFTIEDAYILGLWCSDGYHRSSSIGLSNTDIDLIKRFSKYFLRKFPKHRLRLRVYIPEIIERPKLDIFDICDKVSYCSVRKAKQVSYHLYVNSRPLLREFQKRRRGISKIKPGLILPYIAGRFDGDGSIGKDLKRDLRITYTTRVEAEIDRSLLEKTDSYQLQIYSYKKARVYVIYCSRLDALKLVKNLLPHSIKLKKIIGLPRRD